MHSEKIVWFVVGLVGLFCGGFVAFLFVGWFLFWFVLNVVICLVLFCFFNWRT